MICTPRVALGSSPLERSLLLLPLHAPTIRATTTETSESAPRVLLFIACSLPEEICAVIDLDRLWILPVDALDIGWLKVSLLGFAKIDISVHSGYTAHTIVLVDQPEPMPEFMRHDVLYTIFVRGRRIIGVKGILLVEYRPGH
jgi:hypothetical protein